MKPLIARPMAAERVAALRDHDLAALRQLREMEARHAAQRSGEQADRAVLQQSVAASWRAAAIRATAADFLAKWSGYAVRHWRAMHPDRSNDNEPGHIPPRIGPRPV